MAQGLRTPLPTSGIPCGSILVVPAFAFAIGGVRITPLWPVRSSRADRFKDHLVHFAIRLLSTPRTCGRTLPPSAQGPLTNKPKHFFVEGFIIVVRLAVAGFNPTASAISESGLPIASSPSASSPPPGGGGIGPRAAAAAWGCGSLAQLLARDAPPLVGRPAFFLLGPREIVPIAIYAFLVLIRVDRPRPTFHPVALAGDPQPSSPHGGRVRCQKQSPCQSWVRGVASLPPARRGVFAGKAVSVLFTFADEVEATGDGIAAGARMVAVVGWSRVGWRQVDYW
jgi:hypothetical protein